nr:MAG TPA: minor tail protein [Caudoviricetes sp.]
MQKLQIQIDKAVNKIDTLTKKYDELKNKKIPTQEYLDVQKQIDETRTRLNKLLEDKEKFKGSKRSTKWLNMESEIEELRNSLPYMEGELQDLVDTGKDFTIGASSDEINKAANNLSLAKSELKMLVKKQEELGQKTERTSGKVKSLASRFKNLVLGVFIFNQISRVFNAMVTAMKDGFKNLAQYSKNYNAQMSALKSSSAQLKNGLATAFSPIVTMALPYITRLVSALNTACDAIARFMAAIRGKNTYTKAKKQVVDYAKSLGTATDAAEGALAAFDEINVLETDSGGGASAGGEATGADAFEEAEIDPEFLLTLEKVKEILEIIAPLVFTIGAGLLTWSIINFLSGLMQTHPLLGKIAAALMIIVGLVLAVYNYINMWKNGVDWGGLIGYIAGVSLVVAGLFVLFGPMAAGIALLVAGAAGIILALKDISENGMNAQNVTLLMISVVGLLIGVFLVFGSTAAMIVAGIMAVIAIFAVLVKAGGNGREVINHLKDAFKALGDFVKKIFAGDFEGALESLKECGRSFGNFFISVAEGIANGFIKMVNMVIDAVNNMLPDTIPDWVPIIGGKSFPKIPHWDATCSLPRLANGAVIRGGQPFAAILGDQPKGQTNIETPLDTMVDAFRQALDERGGGGTPVIRFEGSLAELGRVLRPVIEMENNRVGNSFGRG